MAGCTRAHAADGLTAIARGNLRYPEFVTEENITPSGYGRPKLELQFPI